MPKLGPGRSKLSSYSIAKYGPQTDNDRDWIPEAGNGISSTNGGKAIAWTNSSDANYPTNVAFQQTFLQHLTNQWKCATNGGVPYYCMDKEHSLWSSTHQDIHPAGPTRQEIRANFFVYGAVKAIDSNALICAPEEWGWSGYFYSGYDQQSPGYADRSANGGWYYCPWLLSQFYQRATNTHPLLLDVFTLHCYLQSGEYGSDVSTSLQLRRNRSTRQLWDTHYVDKSATAAIAITNRALSGTGQVWQMTSANALNHLADILFTGGLFTNIVPTQSITLFVLPFGTPPPSPTLQSGRLSASNTFDLWLQGRDGQRYVLLSSSNPADWTPLRTNTLASSSWHVVLPTNGSPSFYRGQWAP